MGVYTPIQFVITGVKHDFFQYLLYGTISTFVKKWYVFNELYTAAAAFTLKDEKQHKLSVLVLQSFSKIQVKHVTMMFDVLWAAGAGGQQGTEAILNNHISCALKCFLFPSF